MSSTSTSDVDVQELNRGMKRLNGHVGLPYEFQPKTKRPCWNMSLDEHSHECQNNVRKIQLENSTACCQAASDEPSRVLVLYLGGTIGMTKNNEGGRYSVTLCRGSGHLDMCCTQRLTQTVLHINILIDAGGSFLNYFRAAWFRRLLQ